MFKINKKHLISVIIVFFIFAYKVDASVSFSEIAWKGTTGGSTYEWIELSGSNGENISGWKIIDGINQLNITIPENSVISNNGFYVIKRTNSDITPYDLSVSFSGGLSDSGEKLILLDSNGETKQTIDFSSGWPDTKMTASQTMQWNGSSWITADPTPNDVNSGISSINLSEDDSNEEVDLNTKQIEKVYKISAKIISPKIVTAGIPFILEQETIGTKKEKVVFGRFVWNFGDGMKKEVNYSDPFEYVYQYPGEYVLTLSYRDNTFDIKPDASDRIVIKVVPPGIIVSSVGSQIDPFVEIENKSSYEIYLNKWILKGAVHSFILPDDMIILPNKKLRLSPKITGFDFNDLSYINIIDSGGQIFATYPKQNIPRVKSTTSINTQNNIVKSDSFENGKLKDSEEIINLNDLEANVINSDISSKISSNFYSWLGLIFIIIIGSTTIILIRRKKDYPDYIEGEVSAKDMTIIE